MGEIHNESIDLMDFFAEHTSSDYPVGVYYIDFSNMFMKKIRVHWHKEMEINLIKQGKVLYTIGENTIEVDEGNAILINANRIHSAKPLTDNAIIISILFSPDYLFDNNESFISMKYKRPVSDNTGFSHSLFNRNTRNERIGIDYINSILSVNLEKSYGYELLTKSYLCILWIELIKLSESTKKLKDNALSLIDEERSKKAMLFIHQNYYSNLTLDSIAADIHISKSECCRSFKRATLLTPFEYIMEYRIYQAAHKMQRGAENVNLVAALSNDVGFNNPSYFNKTFKKYIGCTPTEYRSIIKQSHRDALSPFGISLSKL